MLVSCCGATEENLYGIARGNVREGCALPSVSAFSTKGRALRLPVAASTVLGGGVFRSANKGQKEKPAGFFTAGGTDAAIKAAW